MTGTTNPKDISTKLQRIAELASWTPKRAINPLSHNIDIDWLKEAYRRTRKDGAVGVDGQTSTEYAANLESNLQTLLDRAKSGRYFAPPVRRVHIPKDDGKTRPLGIPTFEDKVLQRAVVMALEPIYEQDFLDCSYGFRPGRSAHQALESFWQQAMRMGGGWVHPFQGLGFLPDVDVGVATSGRQHDEKLDMSCRGLLMDSHVSRCRVVAFHTAESSYRDGTRHL